MASEILWQHDCPGYIQSEFVDDVAWIVCYVDEEPSPPPTDRVTQGLRVLYTFQDGSGKTVHDVSNVGNPLNLTLENEGAATWMPEGGLSINSPAIISSAGAASKVTEAARNSNVANMIPADFLIGTDLALISAINPL